MEEQNTPFETEQPQGTPVPPEQPQIVYVQAPVKEKNGLAIAGFVCALLGLIIYLFLTSLGFLAFPLSLVGLILSVKSRKHSRTGLGTAGLVLGIIGICLEVLSVLCIACVTLTCIGGMEGMEDFSGMEDFWDMLEEGLEGAETLTLGLLR